MTPYFVYIAECADGTFYTGITTDLARRIREHNESPKGAKYTRARRPIRVEYVEEVTSRSDAQIREAQLKTLARSEKQELFLRKKNLLS